MSLEENRYSVTVVETPAGWRVSILDPGGALAAERACGDAVEARLYASTVSQHIAWLSPATFREYYRLEV